MKFNCTGCGTCCWDVAPLMPAKADGSCAHLLADRKTCGIYETRPDVCRVDKTRPEAMTEAEWYEINSRACVTLRRHYGIAEPEGSTTCGA